MRYLRQLLGRQPSQEPGAFGAFLHRQGAFVAQKTVLDYCRVKIGRNEKDFFGNADFMAAQGSLIVFVVALFWFGKRQNQIDEEFGVQED